MATILDGAKLAAKIKESVRNEARQMDRGRPPHLVVVLVGEDPASQVYVRGKEKDCLECGFSQETIRLPAGVSQSQLEALIQELNTNGGVDGILCQLPLPKGISESAILQKIAPEKDVDCFHPLNVGRLAIGQPYVLPCTPAGVMRLLKEYSISVSGLHCVIIGRSNIVGKPLAQMLIQKGATVTVCNSKTAHLDAHTRQADILISAAGHAGLVTADMVQHGTVVVDVGMNRNKEGKLCGDVDYEPVAQKASFITPVPGGIGPMTRAILMENTLKAAKNTFIL